MSMRMILVLNILFFLIDIAMSAAYIMMIATISGMAMSVDIPFESHL